MSNQRYGCHKRGHFQKVCGVKVPSRLFQLRIQIQTWVSLEYVVHNPETKSSPWMSTVSINEGKIRFKVDTGADVTVIPENEYCSEVDGPLIPLSMILSGPNDKTLKVHGKFTAKMVSSNHKCNQDVYVMQLRVRHTFIGATCYSIPRDTGIYSTYTSKRGCNSISRIILRVRQTKD